MFRIPENHRTQTNLDVASVLQVLAVALALMLIPNLSVLAQTGVDSDRAIAVFSEAQDLHERGSLVEAIELYRAALKIFPEFPEASFQLGIALVQSGERTEAEDVFRRTIELRPGWTLPMGPLAKLLGERREFTEALAILDEGIELEPNNPALWAERASILLIDGSGLTSKRAEIGTALSRLEELTRGTNPSVSALFIRARLEHHLGNPDSSLSSLRRVLEIDPGHLGALQLKGEIELASGDFLSAVQTADRLIEVTRADAGSLLLKSEALIGMSRKQDAMDLLRSIKTDDPRVIDAVNSLLVENIGDAETLLSLLKSSPENPDVLFRVCRSREIVGLESSISACTKLMTISPERSSAALSSRAVALLQERKPLEALADFQKILASNPTNNSAKAGRSRALFDLERWDEARMSFEELVGISTDFPIAFFYLGIIYDRLLQPENALTNYERFLAVADRQRMSDEIGRAELRLSVLRRQVRPRRN
jgi:tetratricopeptide (TPR) repeat protein